MTEDYDPIHVYNKYLDNLTTSESDYSPEFDKCHDKSYDIQGCMSKTSTPSSDSEPLEHPDVSLTSQEFKDDEYSISKPKRITITAKISND